MPEVVNSFQVGAFSTPINGGSLDADVVRNNDLSLRSVHNGHDADPGVHLQSSALASRPAAGVAGRKWLTTDDLRLYYDNGSAWAEVVYARVGATVSFAGVTSSGGFIATSAAESQVTVAKTGANANTSYLYNNGLTSGYYDSTSLRFVFQYTPATSALLLDDVATVALPNTSATQLAVSGTTALTGVVSIGAGLSSELSLVGQAASINMANGAGVPAIQYDSTVNDFVLKGDTLVGSGLTFSNIKTGDVTTTATAGAASALPATPQGYLTVNLNGTDRKIPFYVA